MKILDKNHILNHEQRKLVLDTAINRLKTCGLKSQVSLIKIVAGSPASEFEDDKKTIIVLYIKACYFSKANIRFIICHEIQHRMDELKPDFGYSKGKKEKLGQQYDQHCKYFSEVLAHLWDVYINGRLNKEGLYLTDHSQTIRIKGQFYKRTPSINRCADIHFLKCRGFRDAIRVYNEVWNAMECELSYDQLTDLTKRELSIK